VKKKMRVTFIAQILNQKRKTGLGNYAHDLINTLSEVSPRNEHTCLINQLSSKFSADVHFKSKAVKVINTHLPGRLFYASLIGGRNFFPLDFFIGQSDIVHYLHPPHALPWQLSGKAIMTVHDLLLEFYPELRTPENLYLYKNLPKIVKKVERIIADSHSTKKDIVKTFHLSEEKVNVVHLGIGESFKPVGDLRIIQKTLSYYHINAPFILYLGALAPHKNIIRLLKAFVLVVKRKDGAVQLVVAGEKHWDYQNIIQEVQNLGLKDKVIFTGYVKDKDRPTLYSAASVFAYPTLYEGFGLPVLEAFACGSAVVTSNISSIPEIAKDAALLVDPENHVEIAKAISSILDNKKLRLKLSQKAIQKASNFTLAKMAQETLKVYENVLLEGRRNK